VTKRNTTVAEPAYIPPWVELDAWGEFTKGDKIVIKGERGDFVFMSVHVVAEEVTAVNVIGGLHGHSGWRSFRPERVGVVKKPRTRRTK
jgi:hypothetical protein